MIKELFGGIIPTLERALDVRGLRQEVISSNIANEETPGYKAREIDFQQELKRRMNAPRVELVVTHRDHLPGEGSYGAADVQIVIDNSPGHGWDANSVSLEKEMVRMAENTIMYNATITIMAKKLNGIREAIREGR